MDLKLLFDMQRKLDRDIEERHPRKSHERRLDDKILALQVEWGELLNNERSFKYWSLDQHAKTYAARAVGNGEGRIVRQIFNPLLDEFVDTIHFILSIGLELRADELFGDTQHDVYDYAYQRGNLKQQFSYCLLLTVELQRTHLIKDYIKMLKAFLNLGKMLGFDDEQILAGYKQKNKVNFERQATGY